MSRSKYDMLVSVPWSDVLKGVQMRLLWVYGRFERSYDDVQHDLSFREVNKEKLEFHSRLAYHFCIDVFHWYDVYCELRCFLNMRPRSPRQLNINLCYDFFEEYKKIDPTSGKPASIADAETILNTPFSHKLKRE